VVDPRFWTVAEVAGVMRVSKVTVYRLIHGGELEAIRVGRPFRVPERAVFRYLAGNGASVTVSPGQFVTASPSDQQTGRQP